MKITHESLELTLSEASIGENFDHEEQMFIMTRAICSVLIDIRDGMEKPSGMDRLGPGPRGETYTLPVANGEPGKVLTSVPGSAPSWDCPHGCDCDCPTTV